MPDLSAIGVALSSFNTLKDIAQAMVTLRDAQALQAKVIEFNNALIEAQTKIFLVYDERTTLIEKMRALETEIAALKGWEAEKQRYKLEKLPPGVLVYQLRPEMAQGEPPHCICERCYNQGRKSFLHETEPTNGIYHLRCSACGSNLSAGHFSPPRGFGGGAHY